MTAKDTVRLNLEWLDIMKRIEAVGCGVHDADLSADAEELAERLREVGRHSDARDILPD